jgi:hypothetical protein
MKSWWKVAEVDAILERRMVEDFHNSIEEGRFGRSSDCNGEAAAGLSRVDIDVASELREGAQDQPPPIVNVYLFLLFDLV